MVDQSASSPQLLLLATGGTIAGRSANSTSLNAYTAGTMAGSELLQELPQLQEVAQIQVEQLTNLDSCLLYTSPSPRDVEESRMPSSA